MGQLHPALAKEWDLDDTYIAELELDTISQYADFTVVYSPIPRYPSVARDVAVVVNRSVTAGELLTRIREIGWELLESVQVFDLFTGERLGLDKKSIALSMVFRHAERTLTEEEIAAVYTAVLSGLEAGFGAELRK
ncbi:Phenylalanine--tRNA ligase beta subunit [compost metagenome]